MNLCEGKKKATAISLMINTPNFSLYPLLSPLLIIVVIAQIPLVLVPYGML